MRNWSALGTAAYAVLSISFLIALYLPWPDELSVIPTVAEFSPRWAILTPLPVLLLITRSWVQCSLLLLVTITNLSLILGLNLALPPATGVGSPEIKVGTYNVGGGLIHPNAVLEYYRVKELDALLLQETQSFRMEAFLPAEFNYECQSRLCILSHHEVASLEALSRRVLGGWGNYIARFDLRARGQTIAIYNLHLNTARHELELIGPSFDFWGKASSRYSNRRLESQIASAMVAQHPTPQRHTLIAGDFNLTVQGLIYRKYWSSWVNVFGEVGNGFGYTKRTRIIGARIDHVLHSNNMVAVHVDVGSSLGGDHRPLTATMTLQ
ncbi:MAG: vancomycin resistance protein VanJ [Congregibacter sp.]|jgi:vancomycin resistance protein VanJ